MELGQLERRSRFYVFGLIGLFAGLYLFVAFAWSFMSAQSARICMAMQDLKRTVRYLANNSC